MNIEEKITEIGKRIKELEDVNEAHLSDIQDNKAKIVLLKKSVKSYEKLLEKAKEIEG